MRYDARVTGVSRKGRDRLVDADRAAQPFTVHLVDSEGNESRVEARAVIDASGTWRRPNPAGADGLPALGERAAADLISYQVPNRAQPERYAGKHTVVVGAGDSAFNAIHELVQIAADHPGTRITWAIRRAGQRRNLRRWRRRRTPGARRARAAGQGTLSSPEPSSW